MKYAAHSIILMWFVSLTLVGCDTTENDSQSVERVVATFRTMQLDGRLPGLKKNDHGELNAFRITDKLRKSEWFTPFSATTSDCTRLYTVSVNSSQRDRQYFFCEHGQQTEFIAGFEKLGEGWRQIKQ
jgi:hypothetical protein